VLSPILLVGAAGLAADIARAVRADRGGPLAGRGYVALTVLFGIVFLVCYTAIATPTNFGGACFGMRYYVGFMPLLAFYALRAWARWRHSGAFRTLFFALSAISLAYAVIGVRYSWVQMEHLEHPLVRMLLPLRGF